MRHAFIAAALILTACVSSGGEPIAPTPPPPATAAAPIDAAPVDAAVNAPAGAYALDPRHTSVIWRVRHLGLSLYTARFDRAAGTLDFTAATPAKSALSVTVDATSVSTGLRDKDGKLSFDGEIAKALGAEKNPQIKFVSKSITRTGEKTGLVEGDLTLNGVTKPATMDVTFADAKPSLLAGGKTVMGFGGRMVIKRSDWGVTNWAMFVADEVEILVQAEFKQS